MASYEDGYDPKYGYNKNAFAHGTLPMKVLGTVVKLITMPIGLTSEAIHDYRANRKSPTGLDTTTTASDVYVEVPSDQVNELVAQGQATRADGHAATHELVATEGEGDFDVDEADWVLDEAAAEDDVDDDTPNQHSMVPARVTTAAATARLPFPVVVPQRRPGTKSRGFVRAYAPVLSDKGIDQDVFLGFLKDFHQAAQASPVFDVIMIATAIAGAYPDPVIGAAIQAVQILAGIGQEVQERWRANKFLNQANKEIFMPRGLFVMVVKYKATTGDDAGVSLETIDIGAQAVAKYGDSEPAGNGLEQKGRAVKDRLRVASAQTTGENEMPATCAPLIFPKLENMAARIPEAERKDATASDALKLKSKGAAKWLNDYYDRRAQATYEFKHPDTKLGDLAPASTGFKSRFADPNNAMNTHLITLLTGGKIKAEPLGAKRRWEAAQRKAAKKRAQGLKVTPAKRVLQEDVLYLMVVNMPTDEELARARQQLAEAAAKKTKSQ